MCQSLCPPSPVVTVNCQLVSAIFRSFLQHHPCGGFYHVLRESASTALFPLSVNVAKFAGEDISSIVYFSPEVAVVVLSCCTLISYSIVEYVSKPLDRPLC